MIQLSPSSSQRRLGSIFGIYNDLISMANTARSRLWIPAFAGMTVLFLICVNNANAADTTYTPEGCEFSITLPEDPSVAEACNPDNPKDCYRTGRFTRVYALDSTLKITATCNNAEKGMMERYSGEVMAFTLETMGKDKVDEPESAYQEFPYAKQAILLGGKKLKDGSESLYMGQLWIGKKSVFTVEGEVTGAANAEADSLLTAIMASIKHESQLAKPDQPSEKQDEKADKAPEDKPEKGNLTPP